MSGRNRIKVATLVFKIGYTKQLAYTRLEVKDDIIHFTLPCGKNWPVWKESLEEASIPA